MKGVSDVSEIKVTPSGDDDQPAITAAVKQAAATGAIVRLEAGIFRWDTVGDPWDVGVAIKGAGRTETVVRMGSRVAHGFRWAGNKEQVARLSGSIRGTKGGHFLTVDSDLSNHLTAGDNVSVVSDASFAARGYYNEGEWNVVEDVDSTGVRLKWPLKHTYYVAQEVRLFKYRLLPNVQLSDMTIRGNPGAWRQVAVRATFLSEPVFRNLGLSGRKLDTGLRLEECRGSVVDDIATFDILDLANPETNVWTGYGVHTVGTLNTSVTRLRSLRCRHAFDDSSFAGIQPSRGTSVSQSTANRSPSAGFSTHGGSDGCSFEDVKSVNCGGGFVVRGRGARGYNVSVYGSVLAEDRDIYTALGGQSQDYLHGLSIGERPQDGLRNPGGSDLNFHFKDLHMMDAPTGAHPIYSQWAPMDNARFAVDSLKTNSGISLYFRSRFASGVIIEDSCLENAAGAGIVFSPEGGEEPIVQRNITVRANSFKGYGGALVDVRGSGTPSNDSSLYVVVLDNIVDEKSAAYSSESAVFYFGPNFFPSAANSIVVKGNKVRESSMWSLQSADANGGAGLGATLLRQGNLFMEGFDSAP